MKPKPTKKLIKPTLSNTEIKVIDLIINKEWSVKEIADKLCVTESAIQYHIENIRKKYDVNRFYLALIKYIKESYTLNAKSNTGEEKVPVRPTV